MMRLYFPAVRLLSRQCRQRTALYYAKKLSIFNYSKNTRSINCARSSSSSSRDDVVGDSFLSSLNTSDIETHRELLNQYRLHVAGGQSVFVIQPFLRNCSEFVGKGKIGHELKLSEALALVNTLEWGVVGYESLGMDTFERDTFFGSGQISNLMEKMKKLPQMTALFVSKDK